MSKPTNPAMSRESRDKAYNSACFTFRVAITTTRRILRAALATAGSDRASRARAKRVYAKEYATAQSAYDVAHAEWIAGESDDSDGSL